MLFEKKWKVYYNGQLSLSHLQKALFHLTSWDKS